jgi:hypothetical protein
MSVYTDLISAGATLDHHESDLYVLASAAALAVLRAHGSFPPRGAPRSWRPKLGATQASPFVATDGSTWLDVPFAYDPFWKRAAT